MAADAEETVRALLAARAADATLCPSEVARALAQDWRGAMPAVHAAVDRLAAAGAVRLSWKGEALAARDGPYRIGRPATEAVRQSSQSSRSCRPAGGGPEPESGEGRE